MTGDNMSGQTFRCFIVNKGDHETITNELEERPFRDLPPGDVLVRVRYSSLNYKDAMAATGHPGITKNFPHVPGIDASGTVEQSSDPRYQVGDAVIATGHELGVERWGGWSEFVQVPADWLVPLPDGLSLKEAMTLGTAGFTAAQSVGALRDHGVLPYSGRVIVNGATGGVGSLAIMILANLGYKVVAVSGKTDHHDWVRQLGATEVLGRDALQEQKPRPLLSAEYVGGIDTVGGPTLTTMLKLIDHRGAVACCGVAGGAEMGGTIFPFILRGVALRGIDSAWCPDDQRAQIWQRLASEWKPPRLQQVMRESALSQIEESIDSILSGSHLGRTVITISSD